MSSSLARDYDDALEREMRDWPGVSYSVVIGGKHRRVIVSYAGARRSVSMPSTPSDSRYGVHNFKGDLRRALRDLGAVSIDRGRASSRRDRSRAAPRPTPPPAISDPRPDGFAELRALQARMASETPPATTVEAPRASLTKRFFDWLLGDRS
jgi:hypothetical protein